MRQARAGHDTCGQRVTPRCRWAGGLAGQRGDAPSEARSADGSRAGRHPPAHTATRHHWCGGRWRTRGPGCGARGRGQGLAGQRADAPSEARGADGSRAGRHPPAHTATRHHRCGGRRRGRRAPAGFEIDHSEPQARVWRSRGWPGPTAPGTPVGPQATQAGRPPPTGTPSSPARQHTTRRPERQRRHTKHSTGARARRPAPLDATTQTRTLRSTCVPCRSARAARQWRRSSRSPHLRRRAGPRH